MDLSWAIKRMFSKSLKVSPQFGKFFIGILAEQPYFQEAESFFIFVPRFARGHCCCAVIHPLPPACGQTRESPPDIQPSIQRLLPSPFCFLPSPPCTLALLVIIVLLGGLARFWNLAWDDGAYSFHPDEWALNQVVRRLGSDLNPHFFFYGSFPVYLYRALAGTLSAATGIDSFRNLKSEISNRKSHHVANL